MRTSLKTLWQTNGTEWLLDEYGLWCNLPGELRLGYPKKAAFVLLKGQSIRLPRIDGDLATEITLWLNELGERYPDREQALILYHIRRRPFATIGAILAVSRDKAADIYREAVAWMDSKIADYFKLTQAQRIVLKSLMLEC